MSKLYLHTWIKDQRVSKKEKIEKKGLQEQILFWLPALKTLPCFTSKRQFEQKI